MRLIVCGGREDDLSPVGKAIILGLAGMFGGQVTVAHGAARGVDSQADAWARTLGLPVEAFPADWDNHGRSAGPRRNEAMLAAAPTDLVLAVKPMFDWRGSHGGTEHMVALARHNGVPAYVLQRAGP